MKYFIMIYKRFWTRIAIEDCNSESKEPSALVDGESNQLKFTLEEEYIDFLRFTFEHDTTNACSINEQIIACWYNNRFEFPHLYIISLATLSIKNARVCFLKQRNLCQITGAPWKCQLWICVFF